MTAHRPNGSAEPKQYRQQSSWLSLPGPLRQIFDRFPLVTYESNPLPQHAPRRRNRHVLYMFAGLSESRNASLSCNPSCLKWQAFLHFQNIRLRIQHSNNHASPTGALPFLLPATKDSNDRPGSPVTANRMPKWIVSQGGSEQPMQKKEEAYTSLIDHDIRNAWLYSLYLEQDNFDAVAWPLYVRSASSNFFVQKALAYQLQAAAREELLKSYDIIDRTEIYDKAGKAFKALATQLGENTYFFGLESPSLFDASLFAYTQLLLDDAMTWRGTTLTDLLNQNEVLVKHRNHLLSRYFQPVTDA